MADILGLHSWAAAEPGVFELCVKLGRETTAVGAALGYVLEINFGLTSTEFTGTTDEVLEQNIRSIVQFVGKNTRGVVLQDHLKGRPSEVGYLNGLVARKGKLAKVPTPYNEAIVEVTRRIELGTLNPDRSNLALVEEIAEQLSR